MHLPHSPGWLGLLLVGGLLESAALRASEPLEKPRYTPTQRLARERLDAAQKSIDHLALLHRTLPPPPGWLDLRCTFHAHAEDSAHTGGSRPEMLEDAVTAGVQVVFLSDHYRPPRDFMDSWRFQTNGVLFIPGSECRGFLVHPDASVMKQMDAAVPEFVKTVGAGSGMIFLSHIEERPDHSMEGLTGMEIYNRHYDAKRDMAGLINVAMRLTDPKSLAEFEELVRIYPDGVLAGQVEYPQLYLEKWDREGQTRHLTGVAANDCHHNQIFILKKLDETTAGLGTNVDPDSGLQKIKVSERPSLRSLLEGRKVGEIVAQVDLDPYLRAFRCVSTHVQATEKTEAGLRSAVKAGHVFVAHEWMGDATGFQCVTFPAKGSAAAPGARMGDTIPFSEGIRLRVESPLPGKIRLLHNGETRSMAVGQMLETGIQDPGVYRVEVWLEIDGEWRPWIYGNPIYVRPS
jgi:hypothetical protein